MGNKKNTNITYSLVKEMPDELEENVLYISHEYFVAMHLCACGCKNKSITPLDLEGWDIHYSDGDKKVTLFPAIKNSKFRCNSRYWIKNNKFEWV